MITHKYEPVICGNALRIYGAYMLGYTVGPCAYSDGYSKPPDRVFPVRLTPSIGLRPISLTLDFEGSSDREIANNISAMTKDLMDNAEIFLPDGYWYKCAFDSATAPEVKAPWIQQVTFSLHAVRHGQLETIMLSQSGSIYVGGNTGAPAIVTLYPIPGVSVMSYNDYTINRSDTVIIDGINGTVTNAQGLNVYGDTDIMRWPMLNPGKQDVEISGISKVEISYFPIYV